MSSFQKFDNFTENLRNQNINNNDYILITDKLNIDSAIRHCLLSKVIQKKINSNILVLADKKKHLSLKIYEIFNIKNIHISFEFKDLFYNIFFTVYALLIYLSLVLKFTISKNPCNDFIDNFKFYNVHVGDLIYDTYIRKNHGYLNFSIFNLKFLKIFFTTFFRLKKIKSLFNLHKIKVVISSCKAFNFGGNLAIRYASKMGCKVYQHADLFFREIDSYDICLDNIFKVYKEELSNFEKNEDKKNIDNFINDRFFKNNPGNYVQKHTFQKVWTNSKDIKKKDFIQKLTKDSDIIIKDNSLLNLIALNCFSDCPRSMFKNGIFIFQDYYDFFVKSIEEISKLDKKNIWLIKPHPENLSYNEGGLIESLLEKYKLANVFICPENISNIDYFNIIDNLITARSTIALEYACFGAKPIICGSTSFSSLGFTHEPQNINEYFNILKNFDFANKLTEDEKDNARATLYILDHFKMSHVEKSIILPQRKEFLNIDKKLFNDEYLKKLNFNLDNNKVNNFFEDPYYKNLESLVKNLSKM